MLDWAAAEGYAVVVTDWRATNLLSSRTWPKLGFRPTFLPPLPRDRLSVTAALRLVGWRHGTHPPPRRAPGCRSSRSTTTRCCCCRRPPLDPLRDVAAAVGEALRYPLSGPRARRSRHARRAGSRSSSSPARCHCPVRRDDPRQQAVAAVIDELERLGMPAEQHTILIAGGLERRAGRRELEAVLRPTGARDFRGTVEVHDATSDGAPASSSSTARRRCGSTARSSTPTSSSASRPPRRRSAAAPARSSVPARPRTSRRSAPAPSLLAPSLSPTGVLAGRVAAALARRTAVTGVSIVLDHPRLTGRYRGYPSSPRALTSLAHSPLRRLVNVLPGADPQRGAAAARAGAHRRRRPRRATRRLPRRGAPARRLAARRSRWPSSSTRSSCRSRGCRCTSPASR